MDVDAEIRFQHGVPRAKAYRAAARQRQAAVRLDTFFEFDDQLATPGREELSTIGPARCLRPTDQPPRIPDVNATHDRPHQNLWSERDVEGLV
jgi:hypothetical protein